jgi:hypothetical protein
VSSTAPPDAPPPPFAEPSPAPAEPAPPDAPPPTEPPATATPAPAPTAPPGAPTSAGSAAFAPLPEAPKPKKAAPSSAPSPTPVATSASADSSAPIPAPNPSAPNGSPPTPDSANNSDDTNGLFGPFRIGVLVGGGLPDLVSLGGTIKVTRYFGAGINVGLIPTVKISFYGDATLSFQEYDAYGHIFPFGGAFFLGAGVGYATVKGTLATNFDLSSYQKKYPGSGIPPSVDVTSQASVRTLVLTPQLGLLHTFGSGFTLGADVGAQVPIAPSQVDFSTQIPSTIPEQFRSQIETQYVAPNDAKVRSSLDKIGRTPIPTFGIKIGWLL